MNASTSKSARAAAAKAEFEQSKAALHADDDEPAAVSTTRKYIGLIANIVVTVAGFAAAVAISNSLAVAAFAATGSVFLTYFVYYLLAILISLAGFALGCFVQATIIDGGMAKSVTSKITGWFSKKDHVSV